MDRETLEAAAREAQIHGGLTPLELATQLESIAIMNARHRPTDAALLRSAARLIQALAQQAEQNTAAGSGGPHEPLGNESAKLVGGE